MSSAPDNHFASGPDYRVIVPCNRRVGGLGQRRGCYQQDQPKHCVRPVGLRDHFPLASAVQRQSRCVEQLLSANQFHDPDGSE